MLHSNIHRCSSLLRMRCKLRLHWSKHLKADKYPKDEQHILLVRFQGNSLSFILVVMQNGTTCKKKEFSMILKTMYAFIIWLEIPLQGLHSKRSCQNLNAQIHNIHCCIICNRKYPNVHQQGTSWKGFGLYSHNGVLCNCEKEMRNTIPLHYLCFCSCTLMY